MYHITLQFASIKKNVPTSLHLRKWAKAALQNQIASAALTIRMVNIEEMSKLNFLYRKKQGPTNVLSFPADIPSEVTLKIPLLGDIVICQEVVNQEAATQQKTVEAHWAHMVIHGVFHLLGYDHKTNEEAEIMESLEKAVMRKLGYKNPYDMSEINDYD